MVKQCVIDGEMEQLPIIARPPPGAIPINHFTQTAFIKTSMTRWTIVRYITFQSDSGDGKVKSALARSHAHGNLYLINYGTNMKNGKKAFQYLFQELGGFQIRQWELQGGSAPGGAIDCDEEIQAIDKGFEHIEKCWNERSVPANGLKQLHWIDGNQWG